MHRIVHVAALAALLSPAAACAQLGLWRTAVELRPSHSAAAGAFLDGERGLTVGAWGVVHVTGDGGGTWIAAEKVSTGLFAAELGEGGRAWAAGEGTQPYLSTDGGRRWVKGGALGEGLRSLSFADAAQGVAASADRVGITADGGRSWRRVGLPGEAGAVATVAATIEGGGLVVRLLDEEGRLWSSPDEGRTWTPAPSPLVHPVLESLRGQHAAMRLRPDGEGVLVAILDEADGPHGRAWRTRDGGRTWREEAAPGLPPSTLSVAPDCRHFTSADAVALRVYTRH